ncbi:MAG: MGMT family protein [Marinoscillum sp.]
MKKTAIPEKMQKFYGTGTMLHPDKEIVESVINEIPSGRVATIDSICEKLARDHDANVTCPMRTTNFVKTITGIHSDCNESIPFWRVIRKDHLLINSPFTARCAENLEKEGFRVNPNTKGELKVQNVEDRLFTFV